MTSTSEMAQLAEDMAAFFEDEKVITQNRMRKCEMFINDVRLQSHSVRDGLMTLLQHAEDDYSTLLHLERVLNMRECGDHHPGGDGVAAPVSPAHARGGQSRRRGHPEGGPFSMDLSDKSSGGEDVLDDLFNAGGGGASAASASTRRRPIHDPINDQLDEEDGEGNLDDEQDNGMAMRGGGRQQLRQTKSQDVACSLPVSIPLPDPIKAKAAALDFASDLEDLEEDDDRGVQVKKKTEDIPKKIAEIARSLYDTSDTLPCSPRNFAKNF